MSQYKAFPCTQGFGTGSRSRISPGILGPYHRREAAVPDSKGDLNPNPEPNPNLDCCPKFRWIRDPLDYCNKKDPIKTGPLTGPPRTRSSQNDPSGTGSP